MHSRQQLADFFETIRRFSSAVSAVWYGLFGRMQFSLIGINDVIGRSACSDFTH
jgi:hypothetical protein